MKIETFTVNYAVKRSRNFQSVDVGGSVTVKMETLDTMEDVFKEAMRQLAPLVENEAMAAIDEVARAAAMDH